MLPPLRHLLAFDAATCAAMGLVLLVAAGPIAGWTAIPDTVLYWAGALLLPIAAFMVVTSRGVPLRNWAVMLIVVGNIGWALASIALPAIGVFAPNAVGWLVVLAQAVAVAALAALELGAMRKAAVA